MIQIACHYKQVFKLSGGKFQQDGIENLHQEKRLNLNDDDKDK